MFVRRLTTSLKEQHWMTIVIELIIVIIGVFIGTQVSNWNQDRIEKRQVEGLVERLRPALHLTDTQIVGENVYYLTARNYALTALAGWRRDAKVSDSQFVIAAYQASQVTGFGASNQIFSTLLGADQVREVDNQELRDLINRVLGADFAAFTYQTMLTDYRKHVRELIPDSVQERIRDACGDRTLPSGSLFLSPECPITLPETDARDTAAVLRGHPELVGQLDYHLAQSATFRDNLVRYDRSVRRLIAMIEAKQR